MTNAMDMDGFLGHTTKSGDSVFLKNWRKREPPVIDCWLHTRQPIYSVWLHGWPRIVEIEREGVQVLEVWGGQWNCFAGETRFWADGSVARLCDLVGETVEVLAGDGNWRPAEVKSFGVQALRSIRLVPAGVRSNFVLDYQATPNHRWFTTTRGAVTDLRPSDRVLITPRTPAKDGQEYRNGFVHGLIFGDGERVGPSRFQIRLCGAKDAVHAPLLEAYPGYVTTFMLPSRAPDPLIRVKSDVDLKRLPPEESSLDYQAGFLAGWCAADGDQDGHHGSPSKRLSSQNETALAWATARAPQLGFCVTGSGGWPGMETNYGPRSAPLRYICLRPEPVEYKVQAIADEGRSEEVFCVVEPVTHAFTLEGGVVTGNCHDPEDVLRRQYRKSKQTGEREVPPEICPLCTFLEQVRIAVKAGRIGWLSELFRFRGSDKDHERVLRAAGVCNNYPSKPTTEERDELRKAGVSLKESWMENQMARCNYVFTVVDNDHIEDGVQVTTETTLLGDKVKELIKARMTSLGVEEGNPLRNPYCIRFENRPNEAEFHKKYAGIVMEKIKPTAEILRLLRDTEPPDVSMLLKPGNLAELRTSMEAHYVGPAGLFDFAAIFEKAEERQSKQQRGDRATDMDGQIASAGAALDQALAPTTSQAAAKPEAPQAPAKAAPAPTPAPASAPAAASTATDQAAGFECDECQAPMTAEQMVCSKCGADYGQVDPPPPPPPPPPPARKRSEAKAAPGGKRPGVPF